MILLNYQSTYWRQSHAFAQPNTASVPCIYIFKLMVNKMVMVLLMELVMTTKMFVEWFRAFSLSLATIAVSNPILLDEALETAAAAAASGCVRHCFGSWDKFLIWHFRFHKMICVSVFSWGVQGGVKTFLPGFENGFLNYCTVLQFWGGQRNIWVILKT